MKRFIVLAAAAAIAFAATPALAKSKKKYRAPQPLLRRDLRAGWLLGRACGAGRVGGWRGGNDPRSAIRPQPDSLAQAAGASRISATAASSTAAGEPVGRSTSLRGACSLRITSGDPAALSPYLLRAGRLPSNRHPALVILPDQARERFLRDMSMRAGRRRHLGAMRRAAAEAFQRPYMAALEPAMRLDPHDARRAAALLATRTGEDFRLLWACAGHARENAASRRRGG